MRPVYVAAIFGLAALAQLGVPGGMIAGRERVLRLGEAYRFDTEPVDPYDAFRGRYVALRYADREVEVEDAGRFKRGQRIYVVLEEGADGVMRPVAVSFEEPSGGVFLRTRVGHLRSTPDQPDQVVIDYPFDRYYMNEFDAPAAEAAYRAAGREDELTAQAQVRILNGRALLEGVMINDLPIEQYLTGKGDG